MSGNIDAATATAELYSLYQHDVYRYARYSLGSHAEAEDIVQEVFIRVFRTWNDAYEHNGVKTWIWKITRSCIVDHVRKHKKRDMELEFNEELVQMDTTARSNIVELEEKILMLPLSYRQVVILRLVQNWSTEETASILGWTQGKVRTTLHRAVRKLQNALDEGSFAKE